MGDARLQQTASPRPIVPSKLPPFSRFQLHTYSSQLDHTKHNNNHLIPSSVPLHNSPIINSISPLHIEPSHPSIKNFSSQSSSHHTSRFSAALSRDLPSLVSPSHSSRSSYRLSSPYRPPVSATNRLASWTSPYAIRKRQSLFASLPPSLVDSAFRAVHDALEPSTRSTYAAGILRFAEFCDSWAIPEEARMPASAALITAFVSQSCGHYAGQTIRSWLSGLRSWHIYHQAEWHGDDDWVHQSRVTANKEGTEFRRPLRAPVSFEHLHSLRNILDITLPLHAAIWATALVTFFGCRRLGETTVKSLSSFNSLRNATRNTSISFRTISDGRSSASIRIPWTKTTKQVGASIILTSRNDALCPVSALRNHLEVNTGIPPTASLFAYRSLSVNGWSHMFRDTFLSFVMRVWIDLFLSGHSLRIGGAVALLLAGVPPEVVAATGGWTSLAFLLYWRRMEEIIPLYTSKAYNSSQLSSLSGIFEDFRVRQNIPKSMLTSTSIAPTHLHHPVPL